MGDVEMTAFVPTGGYVASRRMKAMQVVGGNLNEVCDMNDPVRILDSYLPDRNFFTGVDRFDQHVNKLRRRGDNVDYMFVCSPNDLEAILLALHDEDFPLG